MFLKFLWDIQGHHESCFIEVLFSRSHIHNDHGNFKVTDCRLHKHSNHSCLPAGVSSRHRCLSDRLVDSFRIAAACLCACSSQLHISARSLTTQEANHSRLAWVWLSVLLCVLRICWSVCSNLPSSLHWPSILQPYVCCTFHIACSNIHKLFDLLCSNSYLYTPCCLVTKKPATDHCVSAALLIDIICPLSLGFCV